MASDDRHHGDTARIRADVLNRESIAITHAMVVLSRWIGEGDARAPLAPVQIRRAA